jgi:hypothetical protein
MQETNLDSVVFPDCLGPTMATALYCDANFRSVAAASLCIIGQIYNFGIRFQNCTEIYTHFIEMAI